MYALGEWLNGRVAVSKTVGCVFESRLPCQKVSNYLLTFFFFLKDVCPYLFLSGILASIAYYMTQDIEYIGIRLVSKIAGVGGLYILILWMMKSVILHESIAFFLKKKQ